MTTNYHTDIPVAAPANVAQINTPLGQLDSAITAQAALITALQNTICQICNARLTLTSGLSVTISDVTAATHVYMALHGGNRIALYTGSLWQLYTFSEIDIAIVGFAANSNFDVFAYDNGSGTVIAETVVWTNDTTRATALVKQDGVYVKSGTLTKRYIGTFRTTATIGQTEDSKLNRLVWSYYNRAIRQIQVTEATDSWNYAGVVWRSWNNSTANRINFLRGVSEDAVQLNFMGCVSVSGSVASLGIGLDSTSAPSGLYSRFGATTLGATTAHYSDLPSAGFHFLQLLEYSNAATSTFYGDNGGTFVQSGAVGSLAA